MRIVNTTCVFKPGTDTFWAIDRLNAAGFGVIDLALDYCWVPGHPFYEDGWLDWAKELKTYADSKGITFYECHGIGLPSSLYKNPDEPCYRVIKVAEILGIKWIVMHPEFIEGKTDPCYDELFADENAKWFRPYLKRCEASGVGVAIENLPWKNCHTAKNIRAIADRLDSPFAGCCWDTGHAHCNGFPPSEMKDLGDTLVTLHIQDSVGMDDHLIPYYGHYDWEGFIHTLREMNYKGEFVLEAHHQMLMAADDPEKQDILLAEMLEVSNRIMQLPLKETLPERRNRT